MSFSRVQSAQLSGLGTTGVTIETDISRGLYLFQIVGLPDKAVEESRERVISALRNNANKNPKAENQKVTVSLSPAELKKEGAYFDLGIAIGYLAALDEFKNIDFNKKLFIGELSLNGDVRPTRGLLSIAQWAKERGFEELYIPQGNQREAELIDGIIFYLVPTLQALIAKLKENKELLTTSYKPSFRTRAQTHIDFGDVRGQESAKRALTIAAAGGHNVVLYGPPGTGKTMLARAFHSILPALSNREFLEVATIYSSIGLIDDALSGLVPVRSPHHSASHVAIIGGGQHIRPGEITLSHNGILYMDEFPEFDRRVIEALREPLEEGYITVARARGSHRFPARFILLAAMNPCPCGYRGSTIKTCSCSASELARYSKKLSGPIVDRVDLWIPVSNVEYEALHENAKERESDRIAEQVAQTRKCQEQRFGKLNSLLSSNEVQTSSRITLGAKRQLQTYAEKLHLSPRSYMRTIKVARTIADLDQSETIEVPHILEALQYRPKID
jgi:magnesium chelatase family protein